MPSVYYAVCPGTGGTDDKKTGSPTITISSGVATLSVAQEGNIGQGFRITYDTSKVCFISKVNSSTSFDVVTATGGTPSDEASAVTVNSITADYASLSAAEAGATDANHLNTSDLETATTILNLVCYAGASADTTACTIAGYTTSSDYYINIYVANGGIQSITSNRHQGAWSTSYYRLEVTSADCLNIEQGYLRVTGFQLLANSASCWCIEIYAHYNSDIRITDCVGRGNGNTAIGFLYARSGTVSATNCIAYDFNGQNWGAFVSSDSSGEHLTMYNCTVYDVTGRGIWVYGGSGYGTITAINCVVTDTGDDFSGTFTSSNYNASEDSSAPGVNSITGITAANTFVAASSGDFALVGLASCLMTGTGPSSDANVPTTDIAGNPRAGTLTSIGAFHKATTNVYYSLSPYGTGDVKTGSPTCGISSGVMTLNTAQTGNIGIGCKITYDTSKVVYISEVTDSTHFEVVDKYGVTPPDISAGTTVNSIAHNWASLSAAEAGADDSGYLNTADLTSANVILNIACYYDHDDQTPDSDAVTVNGYTTSADCFINIFTPIGGSQSINNQRHNGKYSSGKYLWETTLSNGYVRAFQNSDPYTVVDGLQFYAKGTTSSIDCYFILNDANLTITVKNCYFSDSLSAGTGTPGNHRAIYCNGVASGQTASLMFYNNVIHDIFATSAYGINIGAVFPTGYVFCCNNTVYGGYRGIRETVSSTNGDYFNNVVYNTSGSDYSVGSTGINASNNASEDGTAPGTDVDISGYTPSQIWTDAANGDFSIVDTDSPLYDAGVDLSAYFTKDIAGTTRSSWDIGAFEYAVAGPKWNTITPAKWNGVDWGNLKWNGM